MYIVNNFERVSKKKGCWVQRVPICMVNGGSWPEWFPNEQVWTGSHVVRRESPWPERLTRLKALPYHTMLRAVIKTCARYLKRTVNVDLFFLISHMCFHIRKSRPTNKHIYYCYRPPTKLQESKVFTSMCLFTGGCISGSMSFWLWWVGMSGPMSLLWDGYAWSQVPFRGWLYQGVGTLEGTTPGRYTSQKEHPLEDTPQKLHPLEVTLPDADI